jgi:ribosomal protein L31
MKKGIHPQLHLINVTDADGNKWQLLSAKSVNLVINSSRTIHPAWVGFQTEVKNNEKADKLKKFFF